MFRLKLNVSNGNIDEYSIIYKSHSFFKISDYLVFSDRDRHSFLINGSSTIITGSERKTISCIELKQKSSSLNIKKIRQRGGNYLLEGTTSEENALFILNSHGVFEWIGYFEYFWNNKKHNVSKRYLSKFERKKSLDGGYFNLIPNFHRNQKFLLFFRTDRTGKNKKCGMREKTVSYDLLEKLEVIKCKKEWKVIFPDSNFFKVIDFRITEESIIDDYFEVRSIDLENYFVEGSISFFDFCERDVSFHGIWSLVLLILFLSIFVFCLELFNKD